MGRVRTNCDTESSADVLAKLVLAPDVAEVPSAKLAAVLGLTVRRVQQIRAADRKARVDEEVRRAVDLAESRAVRPGYQSRARESA